jgi:hypothetical protein
LEGGERINGMLFEIIRLSKITKPESATLSFSIKKLLSIQNTLSCSIKKLLSTQNLQVVSISVFIPLTFSSHRVVNVMASGLGLNLPGLVEHGHIDSFEQSFSINTHIIEMILREKYMLCA